MRIKYLLLAASPLLQASLGSATQLQPVLLDRQSSPTSDWAAFKLETTEAIDPTVPQLPIGQNEGFGDTHIAASGEDNGENDDESFLDDEFDDEDSLSFSQLLSKKVPGSVTDPLLSIALDKCQKPRAGESSPACILALADVFVGNDSHPEARRLAITELRARVVDRQNRDDLQPQSSWDSISRQQRAATILRLAERILTEDDEYIQSDATHDIAAIVSADMSFYGQDGCSSELLSFFEEHVHSTSVSKREALASLLSAIFSWAEHVWRDVPHPMQLVELIKLELEDPESRKVRETAIRSLAFVSRSVNAEDQAILLALRELITPLIDFAVSRLQDDPKNSVQMFLSPLGPLLFSKTVVLLPGHLANLSRTLVKYGSDKSLDCGTRSHMLSTLHGVVFGGRLSGDPELLMSLYMSLYDSLIQVDGLEEEELSCSLGSAVQSLLFIMGTQLPTDLFVSAISGFANQFHHTQCPSKRRQIILTMQRSIYKHSQALHDFDSVMPTLWETLVAGLQDTDTWVKRTACQVLSSACTESSYCASENGQVKFIPVLLDVIANHPPVRDDALFALFSLTAFFSYDMSLVRPQFSQSVLQTANKYLPTMSKESVDWRVRASLKAMEERRF